MFRDIVRALALMAFAVMGYSQSGNTPDQQAQATTAMPQRDTQAENIVASLFENIRANAKLNRLGRIHQRRDLQALTCTVAATDKVPLFRYGHPVLGNSNLEAAFRNMPSALYATDEAAETAPELQRIAKFVQKHSGYSRYAVAVWRHPKEASRQKYWVAIELYYSAGNEFFLNHFSDAMEWKNEWKEFVVPQCRDAK